MEFLAFIKRSAANARGDIALIMAFGALLLANIAARLMSVRFRRPLGAHSYPFRRAIGGNVALIFALTALPLLTTVGGAMDFGIALANKSATQDAADAAALAGAKAASNYLAQNGTTAAQIALAIQVGNTTAQQIFNANIRTVGGEKTSSASANTTVSSNTPTVVMTVSGTYTPYLLSLAGISSIPINVTSTTTLSPPNSYYQIIFVVDVSGSMGIGADSTTVTNLTNAATIQCAFACHDTTNWEGVTATNYCNSNPGDYFCQASGTSYCPWGSGNCPMVQSTTYSDKRSLAKRYGFKLKIDYVNSAISTFMSQLSSYSTKFPGRFTVAIDTFGSNTNGAGAKFSQIQAPTTNMTTATSTANTIDIETAYATSGGYTYTTSGLTSALGAITNMGDGSAATKMLTYVIFLSDGVEDLQNSSAPDGHQTGTTYTSECTAMKNAGVNVFSIYATYPPIPNDPTRYDVLIKPIASQIAPAMQNCASGQSQYFLANDGTDISNAVNSTFNTIVANSKLRITN